MTKSAINAAASVVINGYCHPRFEPLRRTLLSNFQHFGETGTSVAVFHKGENVVNVWAGYSDTKKQTPWNENTLVNIFSAGKPVPAIVVLQLVQEGKLDLDKPVAYYWPEFGVSYKKEKILTRHFLNHKAALPAVLIPLEGDILYNWDEMIKELENQEPWWSPGDGHGYHPITYGYLIGELVKRVSGMSIDKYVQKNIVNPLNLDFHFGLSPSNIERTATIRKRRNVASKGIYEDLPEDHVTVKAFTNPLTILTGVNTEEWKKAVIPAANGHATAHSLAKFYATLAIGGKYEGFEMLDKKLVPFCYTEESKGEDKVLINNFTRFSLGLFLPFPNGPFPLKYNIFGHPGMGGSIGFADVTNNLSFAFVTNAIGTEIMQEARAQNLIKATYESLGVSIS